MLTNFRVDTFPAERWTFRWILGWQWSWQIWAWCDEEQRWRPPAFVVRCGSLSALTFTGSARSQEQALQKGNSWANYLRKLEARQLEKKQNIKTRYNTTGIPVSKQQYEFWLDGYEELATL